MMLLGNLDLRITISHRHVVLTSIQTFFRGNNTSTVGGCSIAYVVLSGLISTVFSLVKNSSCPR